MTTHYLNKDDADDATAGAIEFVDVELGDDDFMPLDQWFELLAGAKSERRPFFGVDLWSGTSADGRMFKGIVSGEHVLVEFADFAQRSGRTGSAANDDTAFRRR